jgi:aminotransferase
MTRPSPRLAKRVNLKDAHLITRMLNITDGLEGVIKLGRGDPDLLDTPAHIIQAGQEALANGAIH